MYKRIMYKRIMVPLDGSELAERVLPHIYNLAKKGKAVVHLIIVVEKFEMPTHGGVVFDETALRQFQYQHEVAAESYIDKIAELLKTKRIAVKPKVLTGKIADSLIDYAENNSINMIIMATHGRSGISRWIWGSIAEKILHSSTIPVLLVHARSG